MYSLSVKLIRVCIIDNDINISRFSLHFSTDMKIGDICLCAYVCGCMCMCVCVCMCVFLLAFRAF